MNKLNQNTQQFNGEGKYMHEYEDEYEYEQPRSSKRRYIEDDRDEKRNKPRLTFGAIYKTIIILILIAVAYIISVKPPAIMNYFKAKLNGNYGSEFIEYSPENTLDVESIDLYSMELELDEEQFYNLINDNKTIVDRVELEPNKIILFKNIAKQGDPLWFAIEIGIVDSAYQIQKIGFGSLDLPNGWANTMLDKLFVSVNDEGSDASPTEILLALFTKGSINLFNPQNIQIEQDQIIISLSQNNAENITIDDIKELINLMSN